MTIFDAIKQKLSIIDVIGSYITLKKTGVYYKGKCPFHKEKTASFTVSPHRQIYYCFGCQAHGDLIGFLAQIEQYSQIEAAQELIKRFGLPIELESFQNYNPQLFKEKQKYFLMHDLISKWCHHFLSKSKLAQEYLEKRGIKKTTISQFQVGLWPGGHKANQHLLNYLIDEGFSFNHVSNNGFLYLTQTNDLKSGFEDRIIFPIRDYLGHICGLGGRIYKTGDKRVKYYNSRDHGYFSKSSLLYGLDSAKKEIAKTGKVYLAEGYLDVLALVQAGFTNSVATLGTACTWEHLQMLSRYAQKVYITFDGDSAGIKAISSIVHKCWNISLEPYVIILPEKEDPASLLLKGANFGDYAAKAQDIFFFFIKQFEGGSDQSLSAKVQKAKDLLLLIKSIPDKLKQDLLLHQVAENLSLPVNHLNAAIEKLHVKNINSPSPVFENLKTQCIEQTGNNADFEDKKITLLEKQLFYAILVSEPDLKQADQQLIVQWLSAPLKNLTEKILANKQREAIIRGDCFPEDFNPSEQSFIRRIILENESSERKKPLDDIVKEFYKKRWKLVVHHVKIKIKEAQQAKNIETVQKLLSQFEKYKKKMAEKGIV